MEQEKLDPLQSVRIIEQMIHSVRHQVRENGQLYLLWGWVIFICALLHFAAIFWSVTSQGHYIWLLTWPAAAYQFFYLKKRNKTRHVTTYSDEILRGIWMVFVGSGLLSVVIIFQHADWDTMYPVLMLLYGIPTILSGVVLKFRPLIVGGICCWVLGIIAAFVPLLYNLLLTAAAVASAWIVPGYLLRTRPTLA